MKTENSAEYDVSIGEVITIEVTPIGVAAFVAAARDGARMTPEPGTADTNPTYVFTVSDSAMVKMEFSFPGAPSTAKYDVVITGSGGGDTGSFTILQTASIKAPTLTFMVV